jgi:hypothetical protein
MVAGKRLSLDALPRGGPLIGVEGIMGLGPWQISGHCDSFGRLFESREM